MLVLATASDVLTKIAQSISDFFANIPDWDWASIWLWIKGILVSFLSGTSIWALLRFAVPFFKDSGLKKVLQAFIDFKDSFDKAKLAQDEKDRTFGAILTDWITLQATTNLTSRTLTEEQKQAFVALADRMVAYNASLQPQADKIKEIVEDNVVTADEALALAETTKIGQEILGTSIDSVVSK